MRKRFKWNNIFRKYLSNSWCSASQSVNYTFSSTPFSKSVGFLAIILTSFSQEKCQCCIQIRKIALFIIRNRQEYTLTIFFLKQVLCAAIPDNLRLSLFALCSCLFCANNQFWIKSIFHTEWHASEFDLNNFISFFPYFCLWIDI